MSIHTLQDLAGDRLILPALSIAMGSIPGAKSVSKFGTNTSVGTAPEYIWEQGNGWFYLPVATTLEVASSSVNDVMTSGSGAWSIVIEGLDANYNEIEETVELNGQTPVLTTLEFLYVNRVYIGTVLPGLQAAGSDEVNQGDIYVADDSTAWTAGVPVTSASIQAKILVEHGQTQQCIYTVPAGYTAYVVSGYVVTSSNQDSVFRVMTWNRTTNTRRTAFEGTISNSEFIKNNNPYIRLNSRVTVYVEAENPTSASAVSAGLDMILVDNKYLS